MSEEVCDVAPRDAHHSHDCVGNTRQQTILSVCEGGEGKGGGGRREGGSEEGGRGRREGRKNNRPMICHCDVRTYPKQASMDQSSRVSGVSAVLWLT